RLLADLGGEAVVGADHDDRAVGGHLLAELPRFGHSTSPSGGANAPLSPRAAGANATAVPWWAGSPRGRRPRPRAAGRPKPVAATHTPTHRANAAGHAGAKNVSRPSGVGRGRSPPARPPGRRGASR